MAGGFVRVRRHSESGRNTFVRWSRGSDKLRKQNQIVNHMWILDLRPSLPMVAVKLPVPELAGVAQEGGKRTNPSEGTPTPALHKHLLDGSLPRDVCSYLFLGQL